MSLTASANPISAVCDRVLCRHCGTGFFPTDLQPDFCCSGCQFVYELIKASELDQFYDLQDSKLPPVGSFVFHKRDYSWLESLVAVAEENPQARLTLDLQGISCIGCVWLVQRLFQRKTGALSISVDTAKGRMNLCWVSGELNVEDFCRELQKFGYLAGPPSTQRMVSADRSLTLRMGICGALALNTMLFILPSYLGMESGFEFATLFSKLAWITATLGFLVGGSYFFVRSWRGLQNGVLHIDLPISLGLIVAWIGSSYAVWTGAPGFIYLDFVSIFVFLMLTGRWVQQRTVERNRNHLLGLQSAPAPVRIVLPGDAPSQKCAVSEMVAGLEYELDSGQPTPVRSRLVSAGATLGMDWINGESEADLSREGQVVPAGAVNLGNAGIRLTALENWESSMLAKLLELTPENVTTNRVLERFIRGYILVASFTAFAGFAWYLATGAGLAAALQVLVSVLVVSCPCAAGVALPMADDLAAASLRKSGVFVRDSTLWQRLGRVRKIIFDKTGTLTLETMRLQNPEILQSLSSGQRTVLTQMVGDNLHPASCCLREALLGGRVTIEINKQEIQEKVGFGLEMRNDEGLWRLGRPGWGCESASHSDCEFSLNGRLLAGFSFSEQIREEAGEEIAELQNRGLEIWLLSGDRKEKVAKMAHRLDLEPSFCFGEMSPAEKAEFVVKIDRQDTLMVGDGANDSLAFNASYCKGTPAIDRGLLEHKSDFYFLGKSLRGVRALLETAERRSRTVRTVVTFAITYNFVAIILCLAGLMNPLLAAILMPLSSVASLALVFWGVNKSVNIAK